LQGWQHRIPFGCFVSVLHTGVAIPPAFVVSLFPLRSQGMARAARGGGPSPSAAEKNGSQFKLKVVGATLA